MNLRPACSALVWMCAVLIHCGRGQPHQQRQRVATSSRVASVGGQQVLDCSLTYPGGQPTNYILQWRKDGITDPILIKYDGYSAQVNNEQYRGRLSLVRGISLQISYIRSEDEGWYECDVTFISDTSSKVSANGTWIYLTVHSPPTITESSRNMLQHRRGESIKIFCRGTGSPEPVLVWRKDGVVLDNSPRMRVDGGEVRITDLDREDGGVYTCTFTNAVGERSQLIKLVVEGKPYIMQPPRNTTAIEGQRVKMPCSAEAYPENITYYWYKDGTDVRMLPVYGKRLTLTDDGLLLTGVVKEDMGWYTCKPSNGIGQDEARGYLNVTYIPRVITRLIPVSVVWAKGMEQSLHCPVDANPPMVETIWTKGQQTKIERRGRFDIFLNGTLLVSDVQQTDAGSYSCSPVSALGRGEPSPNIQVIVRDSPDPPYFTLRPAPQYHQQPEQTVTLNCAASGTPSPTIFWRKVDDDDFRIDGNRVIFDGGNLSVLSTRKEDHGIYECAASNTIATIVAVTELYIENTTPHAPYNVSVIPNLFSAEISWAPAYDGGWPQFYMLWFRPLGGSWGQLTIPGQATSFTLYNLQPNTDYEFMVLSRNELGNGSFSEVVVARTLDPDRKLRPRTTVKTMGYNPDMVTALPTDEYGSTYLPDLKESLGPKPTPPRNVTAERQGERNILVRWSPPASPPVPVFYYILEYLLGSANAEQWLQYNKTVGESMLMDGVVPNMYQLRVLACGVLACSPPSNIVAVDFPSEGRLFPDAMIGGIVGGLLFLLVAVLLTTVAIIHSHRKGTKSRTNASYADVNYGKPEDANNRQQRNSRKAKLRQNGIAGTRMEEETL